ncbi:MAG TPA: hypothetical protein VFZ44_11225 [Pyrinomonadaceae bacterium]
MRRSFTRLAVAPLKLLLGMGVVWGCDRLSEPASAAVESLFPGATADELRRVIHDPMGRVTDGLRVTFLRTEKGEHAVYGLFLITNESPEAVAYFSFDGKSGFADRVKQRGVMTTSGSACGTGLGAAVLRPGESAFFSTTVPDGRAAFEAEFRFSVVSAGTGWKTVRSDTVLPPPQ